MILLMTVMFVVALAAVGLYSALREPKAASRKGEGPQ